MNNPDELPLKVLHELDELLAKSEASKPTPQLHKDKINNIVYFLEGLDFEAINDLHVRHKDEFLVIKDLASLFPKRKQNTLMFFDRVNGSVQINTEEEMDVLRIEENGDFLHNGRIFKSSPILASKILNLLK